MAQLLWCLRSADFRMTLQAQTPPRSRTPPPGNGSTPQPDGGGAGFRDSGYYSGPPQQYGGTYGASNPQQQLPSPHMQQQAPTPPQQPREYVGSYGSGNGVPSPVPQQQYYSPLPQMQPDYGPNSALAAEHAVWKMARVCPTCCHRQITAARGNWQCS